MKSGYTYKYYPNGFSDYYSVEVDVISFSKETNTCRARVLFVDKLLNDKYPVGSIVTFIDKSGWKLVRRSIDIWIELEKRLEKEMNK